MDIRLLNGKTVTVPAEAEETGPEAVDAFIAQAHADAGLSKEFAENQRIAAAYKARRAKAPTVKGEDGKDRPETEEESRAAVRAAKE